MNSKNIVDYLKTYKTNLIQYDEYDDIFEVLVNKVKIKINLTLDNFEILDIKADRNTCFNLKNYENHSLLMLMIKFFASGYSPIMFTLEKKWQTGRDPVFLDLMLKNPTNGFVYMIEVKTLDEFKSYTNPSNSKKVKQLFSYAMQEKNTKTCSFYTYDFNNHLDLFANVFCEDLRNNSYNVDDFFERWNKKFDTNDIFPTSNPFSIVKSIIKFESLNPIEQKDTKYLFNQFLTILRLNSISDKPNAFIRMINLFLAKITDEISENKDFKVTDLFNNTRIYNGLKFQYIEGIDTPVSFIKRLNELYKEGMKNFLNREIIDYSDEEISKYFDKGVKSDLILLIDNLRLKKSNNFSFIEVFDDTTFIENAMVVKDLVKSLENFRLKYDNKYQFLGDFFEDLLNTSLKQEAGQFFTPYPLVDFMVASLPIQEKIKQNISEKKIDFVPSMIDFACGAGHFLISFMAEVQRIINEIKPANFNLTKQQNLKIEQYQKGPYSWVNKTNIVGVEKDYRLAKTSKIASFLNGDGDAEIITGDGINSFSSNEYLNTILYSTDNKLEKLDFLISNPPFSVDGFMHNFLKYGISMDSKTFSLLDDELNFSDSAIEIFFVERMFQLLKPGGWASLILPQSFLNSDKYIKARNFLISNFYIKSMLLTADITFSGTSTSPVTFFIQKKSKTKMETNYKLLIISSPKYKNPNGKNLNKSESQFLGYEFSKNRSKSGITLIQNSDLSKILSFNKQFLLNQDMYPSDDISEYCKVVELNHILLNATDDSIGDIYPKRETVIGIPLSTYFHINSRKESDFVNKPSQYIEIGDLETQVPSNPKSTNRYCKKGDILVSSLTPRFSKIQIAKNDFMVSPAIHVLSFKSKLPDDQILKIFNKLRDPSTLKQMNCLLDGFKVTYSKISENNLINNILI